MISVAGKKSFRHSISNAGEVLQILRTHPFPLALGGHMHVRETLRYAIDGQDTRFEQAAAVVGPTPTQAIRFESGITVYRVQNGVISAGQFIRL